MVLTYPQREWHVRWRGWLLKSVAAETANMFNETPLKSHMGHEKKTLTFPYAGWLMGIPVIVCCSRHLTG